MKLQLLLSSCTVQLKSLGQAITPPFQMRWETDMLGSCANSPFIPFSGTCPSPWGQWGAPWTPFIERGGPLWKQSPPDCYSAAIWHTSVCVPSQNKDTELLTKGYIYFLRFTNCADFQCHRNTYHSTQHTVSKSDVLLFKMVGLGLQSQCSHVFFWRSFLQCIVSVLWCCTYTVENGKHYILS